MNKIFSIFRKLFKKKRVVPDDGGCWNCKHTNLTFHDVPCCWCDKYSEWEPQKK